MAAITAPGPSVSSPSLLTPRQGAMSLQPQLTALVEAGPSSSRPGSAHERPTSAVEPPAAAAIEAPDVDDRAARSPSPALTVSNGPNSPPSNPDSLPPSSSTAPSPNPTSASSSSQPSGPTAHAASVGLGSLAGEAELKSALGSRDRLWLLVLASEMERFVERVLAGAPVPPHDVPLPTAMLADTFGPSKVLDSTPASKYQRMLVYKTAEWYGLRAVSGPEAVMLLGVLGTLDGKAATLRLANLVKREAAQPAQQFQIMRRAPAANGAETSRATSAAGGDDGDVAARMQKTLEERELAYAQARKRIIGDDGNPAGTGAGGDRVSPAAAPRSQFDDLAPVPRHVYGAEFEVTYPTLHQDGQTTPGPIPAQAVPFAYQQAAYAHPQAAPYAGYPAYPYMPADPGRAVYMPVDPYAGVGPYPGQAAYYQGGWQPGTVAPQHNMGGWVYQNALPVQPGLMPNQGMPMIPQGVQYPAPYPPAQYMAMPPALAPAPPPPGPPSTIFAQPTPLRPGMHPHSSASSSLSSRSYQDGASRPHSRGSTTSTRSAASSVRLGAMYPSAPGQQHYRQRPMMGGQAAGGFSSMTSLSSDQRRGGRGQSPASTTSSRSSRQAASLQSINIQQPQAGQHPLPQRPDWAANNIPYRPSPMPGHAEPSQADFPPLARNGTNAEPMQVEKAKMRAAPPVTAGGPAGLGGAGSVWNGGPARAGPPPAAPMQIAANPRRTPGPAHPQPTPQNAFPAHPSLPAPAAPAQAQPPPADDPDFPRRMPSRAPALYDPSAPRAAPPAPRPPAAASPARVATPAASSAGGPARLDEIEARLAAVGVGAGASVGSPVRPPPSYAKIVRRD